MIINDFRLRLRIDSTYIFSPILHAAHSHSKFDLTVTDSGIEDASPFFQMDWSTYLIFLLVTIVTESLMGAILFHFNEVPLQKLWVVVTANLISHPILWTLCTYVVGFGLGNLVAEIGVVFFEGWWIHRYLSDYYTFGKALRASLYMNIVSYTIGGIFSLFMVGA